MSSMSTRRDHANTLGRLAAAQRGVVARWQARECGVPAAVLRRRVASGHARPWFGDVLLFGWDDHEPPAPVRSLAAWLAGGPGAALGGEEAARRLGAWNRPSGRLDVWTRIHRPPVDEADIRLRRLVDEPASIPLDDGVHVLEPLRVVRQLATELDAYQLTFVVDRLQATGQLDRDAFIAEVDAWYGRPGAAVLRKSRQLHLGHSMGTCNRTEDRVRRILEPRLATPLVNVRNATGIAGAVPDFVWAERRKVVEVDGDWTHGLPGMSEADAQRDAAHRGAGWDVLRIPYRRAWGAIQAVADEIVAFADG